MTLSWSDARRRARAAVAALPPVESTIEEAVGCVLAQPIYAITDLPPFDAAAMDGFAVAGPGPWTVTGQVLAGADPGRLADGTAVSVATGAALPIGTDAVLRRERGVLRDGRIHHGDADTGRLFALDQAVPSGNDIRLRGSECRAGDLLLEPGGVVTPAVAGMAAAAGYDTLTVVRPPRVSVLILGDELLVRGPARDHRVRDALGPMLPAWIGSIGGQAFPAQMLPDTIEAVRDALDDAAADVIVTTGSTARGPVDHLHAALNSLGATYVVDGVAVKPGHPMLMALLPDGRVVIGLPGNPLAAVSALVTLVAPALSTLRGESGADVNDEQGVLAAGVATHPTDSRLIPVRRKMAAGVLAATPLHFAGPSMLRGLTLAEALAVIPPEGGHVGSSVTLLPLP